MNEIHTHPFFNVLILLQGHLATGTGWATWTNARPAPMARRVIWTGTPRPPENPETGEEKETCTRMQERKNIFWHDYTYMCDM